MPRSFKLSRRGARPSRMAKRKRYYSKWNVRNNIRRFYRGAKGFSLRFVTPFASDGVGVMGHYTSTSDPSAKVFDGFSTVLDWSAITPLFDQFKVNSVSLKFIPELPNDTNTTTGFFPLYLAYDADSVAASAGSVSTVLQYDNYKVKNMYRPWEQTYKIKPVVQAGQTTRGFQDLNAPSNAGCIYMYGTGFDVSTTYGQLIITYNITVKDRR